MNRKRQQVCVWGGEGGKSGQRTPEPVTAITGSSDHAVLPICPLVKLSNAGVGGIIQQHLIHNHPPGSVEVGHSVRPPRIIYARDHQHVLKTAAVAGKQIEEITRQKWVCAEVDFANGFFAHDLLKSIRWKDLFQVAFVMTGAWIEVVKALQRERRIDKTGLLQNRQRQRAAHGGGIGVAPQVTELNSGSERFLGRGADESASGVFQRLALLRAERALGQSYSGGSGRCGRGGGGGRAGRAGQ